MSKFNKGDRVKALNGTAILNIGAEYIVSRTEGDSVCVDTGEHGILDYPSDWFAPWSKFKVGDRVFDEMRGRGVVKNIYGKTAPYLVEFEWPFEGHNGNNIGNVVVYSNRGWWCKDCELIAVTPKATNTKPHIVARFFNGRPSPSTSPFVHDSLSQAQAEAERLANKTPGTTFEVYALVSRSVAEVQPAKTEAA